MKKLKRRVLFLLLFLFRVNTKLLTTFRIRVSIEISVKSVKLSKLSFCIEW